MHEGFQWSGAVLREFPAHALCGLDLIIHEVLATPVYKLYTQRIVYIVVIEGNSCKYYQMYHLFARTRGL